MESELAVPQRDASLDHEGVRHTFIAKGTRRRAGYIFVLGPRELGKVSQGDNSVVYGPRGEEHPRIRTRADLADVSNTTRHTIPAATTTAASDRCSWPGRFIPGYGNGGDVNDLAKFSCRLKRGIPAVAEDNKDCIFKPCIC